MSTAAVTRSATASASASMGTPLERPPAMSTSGLLEGTHGGDDGIGLRALGVVDVAHAADLGHRLEAMLDAREATDGSRDGCGVDGVEQADRDSGEDVGDVVLAGQRDVGQAARCGRRARPGPARAPLRIQPSATPTPVGGSAARL